MEWNSIYFSSVEVDKRKMKKNLICFVIILIIISLDPKMVYWSSQGNFSNAILKLISFQPTNKCISSFHLHILISTIHKCQIQKKEHSKMTRSKIPFDFYRKHTWASLYPILQAFLGRETYPSLPAKISPCWEKLL